MIDSPTHHVTDIQLLLTRISSSSCRRLDQEDTEVVVQKMREVVHGSAISSYFVRLSWIKKLNFLTKLSERINSTGSVSLLLNTLHCVTGKITSYAKASTERPILYDTMLDDHNRMLDDEGIEDTMNQDLEWFASISDKDQVALLIGLLRLAGGAIMGTLYKRLQKLYADRLRELNKKKIDEEKAMKAKFAVESEKKSNKKMTLSNGKTGYSYNPDNPKHKECLRVTQIWNNMIGKYKKEVEKASGHAKKKKEGKGNKKNKGIGNKQKEEKGGKKKKGSEKSKKGKSKKKKKNKEDISVDWIQIMPIWIVKKIFSYLDTKTLKKAKKVNEYWKWAITDLMKEQKVIKLLNQTRNKIKVTSATNSEFLIRTSPLKSKKCIYNKRLRKLFDRGAICEKLRCIRTSPLTGDCLIINALNVAPFNVTYLDEITMYPRITRSNPPLYKKPAFLCKDYKIIFKESDITESVDPNDGGTLYFNSEISSISSDEIEF